MKKLLSILTLPLLAMMVWLCPSAFAQGAYDLYASPRFVVLDQGTSTAATSSVTVSNVPIDIHGYDGIAVVLLSAISTNANAGAVMYARLEGSSTGTNGWALLNNCSFMTLSTNNLTNVATAVIATNTYLIPGTVTNSQAPIVAPILGFAGQYLLPQPFTNTSVLLTNVATGVAAIGFVISDQPRYIHVAYTVAGETNNTACFLIGRKNSGWWY